ncbi:hypothetical protein FH972_025315 [Carpinus fangiana]|uniref:Uncharacterized protein n=1 Tax=Carpinus fangiana TaxID=176857 RepID=A0A5N6L0S9_9ROSI|nr:hypothetical protein FH972_025315 [Carpinus fangiana]
MSTLQQIFCLFFLILLPPLVLGDCTCDADDGDRNKHQALQYKLAAVASILIAGAIGVCIPILGKTIPAFRPEKGVFFLIKAFAAGVILSTGFIHVLPDAFESLTSPCLDEKPWRTFPFAGFVAMTSAILTLMVDAFATSYYRSSGFISSPRGGVEDAEKAVIIGISLGASESPKTIRPLVAALTFHQFFEGMGLGGCVSQAKFKVRATAIMVLFFSLTTPIGIAIGTGISNIYNENSPTALIVEGILNAASAGILIYMALVDLVAADFMNPKMQANLRLLIGANVSLLVGAGCMSLLAKWA